MICRPGRRGAPPGVVTLWMPNPGTACHVAGEEQEKEREVPAVGRVAASVRVADCRARGDAGRAGAADATCLGAAGVVGGKAWYGAVDQRRKWDGGRARGAGTGAADGAATIDPTR